MVYPDAWGLTFQEVMGLAWLAYKGNGTSTGAWTVDGQTWTLRHIHEDGSFRAVMIEGEFSVLSFSGTDDRGDWADNISQGTIGLSSQYLRALRLARSTSPDIVLGHSLGGGLASYCAIYGNRPAVTLNPAPLNLNPISIGGMLRNHNLVINYIAPGEILQIMDALAPNMGVVGRIYNVSSLGGWNPIRRHQIGHLEGFQQPVRANMGDFYTG
jgi:hypothetical protein